MPKAKKRTLASRAAGHVAATRYWCKQSQALSEDDPEVQWEDASFKETDPVVVMLREGVARAAAIKSKKPYIGNSERNMRRKRAYFREASKGVQRLEHYFAKQSLPQGSMPPQDDDDNNAGVTPEITMDDGGEVEGFTDSEEERDVALNDPVRIQELLHVLKDNSNSNQANPRYLAVEMYLLFRHAGKNRTDAGIAVATAVGRGAYLARVVHAWAQEFAEFGSISASRRGKNVKVSSLLADETVLLGVNAYLREKKQGSA